MIPTQRITPKKLKKALLMGLLIAWAFLGVYSLLVCLTSVWVAIIYQEEAGFWVPLFLGSLCSVLAFQVFYRGIRFLMSHLLRKEALSV